MYTSNLLDFIINDLEISQNEAVWGIMNGHKNKDEDAIQKSFKDYERIHRMIGFGNEMKNNGLKNWDWKWLVDTGNLCELDWDDDWFKKDLEKAGASKEEYDKKWKTNNAEICINN